MTEAHVFIAVFAAQILALSVLFPARLIRYCRAWPSAYPETLAQLYPGVEPHAAAERYGVSTRRFAAWFGAANLVIALAGMWVVASLFEQMQLSDWDYKRVTLQTLQYFGMQWIPIGLLALCAAWYLLRRPPAMTEPKRKATLQRRGLFDFVSPIAVGFSAVAYFLVVAFTIYLWGNPLSTGNALFWIGLVTAIYAFDAATIYRKLYGRKNRLEPQEGRPHRIGMSIKLTVYANMAVVAMLFAVLAFQNLSLERWTPLALSAFFVVISLLMATMLGLPPRKPDSEVLA